MLQKKISSDIRPQTLSVPRSEQFSERVAQGKLRGTDNTKDII